MKKETITFDELAVLSFLKFTKLDGIDMTILKECLSDVVDIHLEDDNENYFIMTDGTILLEAKYINSFYKNVDISLFESATETLAYKHLDKLDMLEFILRKIKLLGESNIDKDALSDDFSELQIRFIKKLYQLGYLKDCTQKNNGLGEREIIELTKRGELYLYLKANQQELREFTNSLSANGYKISLIELFLMNQNLETGNKHILTLDNFINFCNQFNIDPLLTSDVNENYSKTRTKI